MEDIKFELKNIFVDAIDTRTGQNFEPLPIQHGLPLRENSINGIKQAIQDDLGYCSDLKVEDGEIKTTINRNKYGDWDALDRYELEYTFELVIPDGVY